MRTIRILSVALGFMALGYLLGSSGNFGSPAHAQEELDEVEKKIIKNVETVITAIDTATRVLVEEKRYVPAIQGPNGFAVTSGGGDMIAALKAGRSVDPETYVGLYAGWAVPEVQEKLAKDQDGHLTYNGKVIRMYPIPELTKLFEARIVLAEHLRKN